MFEKPVPAQLPALPGATLSTAALGGLVGRLGRLDTEVDDAERITQLELLERLKGAAAAAQARVSVALDRSQRADQAAQGLPSGKRGSGVAEQIALARHDSTSKGSRHLGLAKVLVNQMPHTLAALTAGRISEWRATIMAGETATLTLEDRQEVDARLADELPRLGDRQLAARAKALGYQLDAASMLRRIRGAVSDRRVSIRPAPDTMALVTGLLPVAQGVAVHAALVAAAAAARAQGDQRSKAQIMADTFVERLTGQRTADAVPLEVPLVMTLRTLSPGTAHRRRSRATDRSRLPTVATSSRDGGASSPATPRWRLRRPAPRSRTWRGSGCAGCTPLRLTARLSPWTPDDAPLTDSCAASSSPATRSAGRRGATRPFVTPTTSRPLGAAHRPPTTVKASANGATTPRSSPAGTPRWREPLSRRAVGTHDTGSSRQPRPVIPTIRWRHRFWACPLTTTRAPSRWPASSYSRPDPVPLWMLRPPVRPAA